MSVQLRQSGPASSMVSKSPVPPQPAQVQSLSGRMTIRSGGLPWRSVRLTGSVPARPVPPPARPVPAPARPAPAVPVGPARRVPATVRRPGSEGGFRLTEVRIAGRRPCKRAYGRMVCRCGRVGGRDQVITGLGQVPHRDGQARRGDTSNGAVSRPEPAAAAPEPCSGESAGVMPTRMAVPPVSAHPGLSRPGVESLRAKQQER